MKFRRRTALLPWIWASRIRLRRSRSHDQAGFTLVELVIVMVILPLLVGGITEAIIASADSSNTVQTRFSDSSEAQVASSYFVRDVDNAALVYTSSTPLCAPAGDASSQILGLEWTQGTADTAVSYVAETSPPSLVRYTCVASTTPTSTVVISSNICTASTGSCQPPTVTVTCYDFFQLTCSPDSAGQWPASGVSAVSLNMTGTGGNTYQYQLTASPRVTETGAGGSPATQAPDPTPPASGNPPVAVPGLLLLGTTAPDLNFDLTSSTLDVNGAVDVDSSPAKGAIIMGTRSNTLNTVPTSGGDGSLPPIQVFACAASAGATCSSSTVTTGQYDIVDPTPVSMSAQVTDPFLADPLPAPATPPGTGNCTASLGGGSGGSGGHGGFGFGTTTTLPPTVVTCQPGLYPSGLDISVNDYNITFAPGNYQFGTAGCTGSCGLDVSGSDDTLNLGSGDYTFEGSDSADSCNQHLNRSSAVNGGFVVTGGTDSLNGTAGVFFYVAGGQANFDCGQSVSVNLAPMTSGSYNGVLLWQSSSDTLPVVLTGNGTGGFGGGFGGFGGGSGSGSGSDNLYTGVIYAPAAQVELTGYGQTLTTGPIVAQSLELGGDLACATVAASSSAC